MDADSSPRSSWSEQQEETDRLCSAADGERMRRQLSQQLRVTRLLRRYPDGRDMLRHLLTRHPRAIDVANPRLGGNPGLVAALAFDMQAARDEAARNALADLITRPRRHVARAVGLPSGPAALTTLARVAPEDCTVDIIVILRALLESADRRARLARLPMVTQVAIYASVHDGLLDWLGHDLLRETATFRDEPAREVANQLFHVAWVQTRAGGGEPVHSLDEMRRIVDADAAGIDSAPFPPPPFDEARTRGVLTPITSVDDLRRAAAELRNCAMSYLDHITLTRTRYLYRVDGEPPGMVLLRRADDGWHVMQVRGPHNTLLDVARVEQVRAVVEAANDVARAPGRRRERSFRRSRPVPFPPPLGIAAIDRAIGAQPATRGMFTVRGDLRQARRLALHWGLHTLWDVMDGTLAVRRDRFSPDLHLACLGWLARRDPSPGAPRTPQDDEALDAAKETLDYFLRRHGTIGDVANDAQLLALAQRLRPERPLVCVWFEDPDEPMTTETWRALRQLTQRPNTCVMVACWSTPPAPSDGGVAHAVACDAWSVHVRPHRLDAETQQCVEVTVALQDAGASAVSTRSLARTDGATAATRSPTPVEGALASGWTVVRCDAGGRFVAA
jgi:hypothetical protein